MRIIRCDECLLEADADLRNWVHVEPLTGYTSVNQRSGPRDFCSQECLARYYHPDARWSAILGGTPIDHPTVRLDRRQ